MRARDRASPSRSCRGDNDDSKRGVLRRDTYFIRGRHNYVMSAVVENAGHIASDVFAIVASQVTHAVGVSKNKAR